MELIGTLLRVIYGLLGAWITVMLVFQLWLTFFGFRKGEKDYADHDPAARFLILVPAHNEERVVPDIIRNLQELEYPRELYDFYIIADNCTDRTAEVARELGAQVIETRRESPDEPTGKPLALKKALLSLGDYENRYDLMMIFDADNLMDDWILREVNSQWLDKGKPDFIQCYLGAKNKSGVVAWFYYTSYTLTNRFFQLAKHRRGLNCAVGGTGFAVTTSFLRERGGWDCVSLTEDFEIQVEATLQGRRVLWNHWARIYDEKPTTLKASIRQKLRWGQGHWYVCLRNTGHAFGALFKGRIGFREFFSTLTYMYSLSAYVVVLLQGIIALVFALFPALGRVGGGQDAVSLIWGIALFVYSYLGLFYLADRIDNGIRFDVRTLPLMLVSFVANMIVGMVNQVVGLLLCRRQHTWVKTEHTLTRGRADALDESRRTRDAA